MLLVLDKGFFSASNICELIESDRNLSLIIPLPFALNLAKELTASNINIKNPQNMFQYNEEILFHKAVPATIKEHDFTAHVFFNEKAEVDQRHLFYSKLMSCETKIKQNKFNSQEAFETYVNEEIQDGFKKYFYYDNTRKAILRNEAKINEYLSKLGFFIIISNNQDLTKEDVLSFYRDKDKVEKIFDNTKNELNANRLHSHSKTTTDGRLFVKFISTILYQHMTKVMKENDLFKKYSITELLKELSKIKMISLPEIDNFASECSKKQKEIFDKFKIAFST